MLEFSIKAGLVVYEFAVNGEAEVEDRAEQVAENVRSIMLNSGGPVAARTVYPIMERNLEDLGYAVAVEPAPITVAAISEGFGFEPKGIPADDWPEGWHRSATVEIEAQEFCLTCHTTASVGDGAGHGHRAHLSRARSRRVVGQHQADGGARARQDRAAFGAAVSAAAGSDGTVAAPARVLGNLARAYGGLDHRAEIRSRDEFGVLARDLNLFLDRITGVVRELDRVLHGWWR